MCTRTNRSNEASLAPPVEEPLCSSVSFDGRMFKKLVAMPPGQDRRDTAYVHWPPRRISTISISAIL
jgi:hypothetical protein